MPIQNDVRPLREARGLSQVALAERVHLTRQSLSAIEAGRSVPSVDVALRLARALDARVEDLFGHGEPDEPVDTVTGEPSATGRVALANIAGRWVSLPLTAEGLRLSADGLVAKAGPGTSRVVPMRPLTDAKENVIVTGCAAALGILSDRLNAQRGPGRFLWFPAGSTAALQALEHGMTHIAGVHLTDAKTGEPNVSFVRKAASGEPLVVLTLARWEAGLLTRTDDAQRIRRIADLGHRRVRLVLREEGSGARRLLTRELRVAGIAPEVTSRASLTAQGHLEVARLIALGVADTGIATRDAALAFGLNFLPLAEERYDLVVPRSVLADPRIERLLDVLVSVGVRRELSSLGYDVEATGQRVAEVTAAPAA
jgi:putative molybdopterin biosynthesis protein